MGKYIKDSSKINSGSVTVRSLEELEQLQLNAMAPFKSSDGSCVVCGGDVRLMTYKGTAICSQKCEKLFKGEK